MVDQYTFKLINGRPVYILIGQWHGSMTSFFIGFIKSFKSTRLVSAALQIWEMIVRDINGKDNDNKSMYIPNDETQNYPFCKFKLVVKIFEHTT